MAFLILFYKNSCKIIFIIPNLGSVTFVVLDLVP